MLSVNIDFYDESRAGVIIEGSASDHKPGQYDPKDAQLNESLLFACFTMRQFNNLGRHPSSEALAVELSTWKPPNTLDELSTAGEKSDYTIALPHQVLYRAAIQIGLEPSRAIDKYGAPLILVPHKGKGKRRFYGNMHLTIEKPTFFLEVKGFGLGTVLGIGVSQYASNSVMLFLAYLATRYSADPDYEQKLQGIAASCTNMFRQGRISTMVQEELAVNIVNEQYF